MGVLRVSVDHTVRISAEAARVHLTVRGSTTLGADLVGKKAALVREVVADLAAHGVMEDSVEVAGVRLSTSNGRLMRSQTVEITLIIHVQPERLGEVLGVLADRSGLTVDEVEWVYNEFEASIPAAAEAMKMARKKADAIANAAGREVLGIVDASDSWSMPTQRVDVGASFRTRGTQGRAQSEPTDLGLELNATTELLVHLGVDFELSP